MKLISVFLTIWFIITASIADVSSVYGEEIPACARSLCGCRTEVEIDYKTTIVSADLIPQPDIKVSCPQ